MPLSLAAALNQIISNLKNRNSPYSDDNSIWTCIVKDTQSNNDFKDDDGYLIEIEISKFLSGLNDEDKILIWKQTETGIDYCKNININNYLCMNTIDMDLETELLVEIIEIAINSSLKQ